VTRFIKNVSWLLLSDMVSKGASFGNALILSHSLAVSGFGTYSYIVAFVELFAVMYDLGLNIGIIKQTAVDDKRELLFVKKAFLFKSIVAILCAVLILSISNLLGDEREVVYLLFVYLIGYTARSFSTFLQSLAIARERIRQMAILNMIDNALLVGGMLLIFMLAPSLRNFMYYYSLQALVMTLIWGGVSFSKRIDAVPGENSEGLSLRKIIKLSFPYFLISLFTYIYFRIDITMLNHMRGSEEVGFYSAGYRIFMLIMTIPWLINRNILLPKIIKDGPQHGDFVERGFPIYLRASLIPIWGICFFVAFLSGEILSFLFGKEYVNGGLQLSILIWSLPFCTLAAYFNNILIERSPKLLAMIAGLILVPMNILLNIPLITKWGGAGAAISTVATEGAGCVVGYFSCKKLGASLPIDIRRGILTPILALAIALALGFVIDSDWAIPPLSILYLLVVYLSGGFKGIVRGAT